MAFKGNVVDFLGTPEAKGTMWYIDPETEHTVTVCESCGAEARHSVEELMAFSFAHAVSCPHAGPAATLDNQNRQAYDLANALFAAIEGAEEKDGLNSRAVLSTLAFVAAGVCVTCEDQPTAAAVEHTIAELRHHAKVVAAIDLPKQAEVKEELTAAEKRHIEDGEALAQTILPALEEAHPATALVALQYAMAEIVVEHFRGNAMKTALGCIHEMTALVGQRLDLPGSVAA